MSRDRDEAAIWFALLALVEDAGIDDLEPGLTCDSAGASLVVSGRSKSRGAVRLGSISRAALQATAKALTDVELDAFRRHELAANAAAFEPVRAYAAELLAKADAPNRARSQASDEKRQQALRLHAAGRSDRYIGNAIGRSRKQVQRYLTPQKPGHDAKGASTRD